MISRRELFRRAIALPVLAAVGSVVGRRRGIPWSIGKCDAKPGDTAVCRAVWVEEDEPLHIGGGGTFVVRD